MENEQVSKIQDQTKLLIELLKPLYLLSLTLGIFILYLYFRDIGYTPVIDMTNAIFSLIFIFFSGFLILLAGVYGIIMPGGWLSYQIDILKEGDYRTEWENFTKIEPISLSLKFFLPWILWDIYYIFTFRFDLFNSEYYFILFLGSLALIILCWSQCLPKPIVKHKATRMFLLVPTIFIGFSVHFMYKIAAALSDNKLEIVDIASKIMFMAIAATVIVVKVRSKKIRASVMCGLVAIISAITLTWKAKDGLTFSSIIMQNYALGNVDVELTVDNKYRKKILHQLWHRDIKVDDNKIKGKLLTRIGTEYVLAVSSPVDSSGKRKLILAIPKDKVEFVSYSTKENRTEKNMKEVLGSSPKRLSEVIVEIYHKITSLF